MSMEIEGQILWLRCNSCSVEFPSFVFSGENDMATVEFRTVTDLASKTLFIYHCEAERPVGLEVVLSRVEKQKAVVGESFQEYHKRLKDRPPKYFYHCINCESEDAEVVKVISEGDLTSKGYSLKMNPRANH